MSWSVNGIGRPAALAAKLAADLARYKCAEPEETIKTAAGQAIAAALGAMPAGAIVKVDANGSQWVPDATKPTEAQNSLHLTISPLGALVE